MVGRPVENLFPPRARHEAGEVVLSVKGLRAAPAVRSVTFDLRRGEVLGIAGLMGSGRTEMVRAIFGLDPIASGEVTVSAGKRASPATLRPRALRERLAAGMGYLSEDRKGEGLALTMSLADNITLTNFGACATRGWIRLAEQREQATRWMRAI